jgi:hypothetical protein
MNLYLLVRSDDGLRGAKHVALYVLLMVTIDVLDENTNTLNKKDDNRFAIIVPHVITIIAHSTGMHLFARILVFFPTQPRIFRK